MSDPNRLLENADNPGANLLRAAHGDAPSEAARRRTAGALGLAVGVTAATTTVTTSAAAASKWGAYGSAALLKWIGVSAVGGVIALGTAQYVARAPDTSAPVAVTAPSSPPLRATRSAPAMPKGVPAATASTPTAIAPAAPNALAPNARPATPLAAATPPNAAHVAPNASASLADEVRALDGARAQLAAGDARGSLAALDAHDRTFPDGALAPEAAVLRIEALAQAGDDAAATARANAFLTNYPSSPQARRVRSVLDAIRTKQNP